MTRERRYLISKLDRAVSNSGKNGGEMARSTWRGKNKNSVWRFDAVNWSDVTRRSNHPRQSSFEPRFTPRCSSRNFFYLKQGGEGREGSSASTYLSSLYLELEEKHRFPGGGQCMLINLLGQFNFQHGASPLLFLFYFIFLSSPYLFPSPGNLSRPTIY